MLLNSGNRYEALGVERPKGRARRRRRAPQPETSCPSLDTGPPQAPHPPASILRRNSDPELLAGASSPEPSAGKGVLPRTNTVAGVTLAALLEADGPRAPAPGEEALAPLRSPRVGLAVSTRRAASAEVGPVAVAEGAGPWAYLLRQLAPPTAKEQPDDVWGQTERDRVYNALVSVPYQLERFIAMGACICLVSSLNVLTLVPLRLLLAGGAWLGRALGGTGREREHVPSSYKPPPRLLTASVLYDALQLLMFGCMLVFMASVNIGSIYYWLKDMTHEFLKLSVLYTALELSDKVGWFGGVGKICCSFGVDVLEALAGSCTRFVRPGGDGRLVLATRLASDVAVTLCLLLVHCSVLLGQAMTLSVALNGKRSTLVGLMIAANFGELKGTVFKRFDSSKLYNLTCQDVTERFHLLAALAFVVAEEMGHSAHSRPSGTLLARCARIAAAEACIDVVKHAVLGKFNEVRAGVYSEFTRDLAGGVCAASANSLHRLVGFEPLAAAALAVRIFLGALGREADLLPRLARWAALLWPALLALRLAVGYALQAACHAYLAHYERTRGAARRLGARAERKAA